jgi:hypothetical protein
MQGLPDWEEILQVPVASTGVIVRPPLEGANSHSFGNLSFLLLWRVEVNDNERPLLTKVTLTLTL